MHDFLGRNTVENSKPTREMSKSVFIDGCYSKDTEKPGNKKEGIAYELHFTD